MAQEQPRRAAMPEPIKYGDVFTVSGKLDETPVAPGDAAAMQSAESQMMGKTQKGGPAAVMQSAATKNVQAGVVRSGAASDIAKNEGVTVSMSEVHGNRVVTEALGDEILGQFTEPKVEMTEPAAALEKDAVTIGEALEAAALSAGDKPVDQSDASAIQAAEMRALGTNTTPSNGLGSEAQRAATLNARTPNPTMMTTIADVLGDAKSKLKDDKAATREDAEAITSAEIRNKPDMATTPGGVAESVVAAARLNQDKPNITGVSEP
ncbi:hypothetical protein V2J09_004971 [Rumex salicifolius]